MHDNSVQKIKWLGPYSYGLSNTIICDVLVIIDHVLNKEFY